MLTPLNRTECAVSGEKALSEYEILHLASIFTGLQLFGKPYLVGCSGLAQLLQDTRQYLWRYSLLLRRYSVADATLANRHRPAQMRNACLHSTIRQSVDMIHRPRPHSALPWPFSGCYAALGYMP